jgi:hypothetical protein
MLDDIGSLGDTDQALGMDDATWSTGGEYYGDEALAGEGGAFAEAAPELAASGTAEALESPLPQADMASLPAELTFGAQLTPLDEPTSDSYAEKVAWSTEKQAYVGLQTGREIDEWTNTEKK